LHVRAGARAVIVPREDLIVRCEERERFERDHATLLSEPISAWSVTVKEGKFQKLFSVPITDGMPQPDLKHTADLPSLVESVDEHGN
jgi:hypothetical protein